MQGSGSATNVKAIEAALATARALVTSLEAALADAAKPSDDRTLTLQLAAKASGLSPHTLRTWCKSGRLRSHRGPRGAYLLKLADVDDAVRADPIRPNQRPRPAPANDLAAWEAEAEGDLCALTRGES